MKVTEEVEKIEKEIKELKEKPDVAEEETVKLICIHADTICY